MRRSLLALPALSLVLTAGQVAAFSSGPPDGHAGDPPGFANCTVCHTSFPVNSGDGELTLSGVPADYSPGVDYTLTIDLVDPDQARWGFEMTVITDAGDEGGILTSLDSFTQVSGTGGDGDRDYIKHTFDGTQAGESAGQWTVEWTAPDEGTGMVTFYLAGNAANNNGNNQGDYIYTINQSAGEATVGVGAPVVSVAPLLRAFPNPLRAAASSLQLSLDVTSAGPLDVRVFDAGGREVLARRGAVEVGTQVVPLRVSDLAPGRYFVRAAWPGAAPQMVPVTLVR